MSDALWIWQQADWPRLSFDLSRLTGLLAVARAEAGRLLGKAESIQLADRTARSCAR